MPFISNQTSDNIWLCTIDTIHENIISSIFSRKNIYELNPGSNPRPLDHEADTQLTELFGQMFNAVIQTVDKLNRHKNQ